MMTVCCKEGIKIDGASLSDVIEASNHDIRQVTILASHFSLTPMLT